MHAHFRSMETVDHRHLMVLTKEIVMGAVCEGLKCTCILYISYIRAQFQILCITVAATAEYEDPELMYTSGIRRKSFHLYVFIMVIYSSHKRCDEQKRSLPTAFCTSLYIMSQKKV